MRRDNYATVLVKQMVTSLVTFRANVGMVNDNRKAVWRFY